MSQFRLRRVGGDHHLVTAHGEAFLGQGEADHTLFVVHDRLDDVRRIAVADEPFAGGDSRLVLLVVELGDVLLPLKHDLDRCIDLLLLLGVE